MDDEDRMRERLVKVGPQVAARAKLVKFQHFIPGHWFSAAASECVQMFIHGHFYGCISVAQAYVEALGKYLSGVHQVRVSNDPPILWGRLSKEGIVSKDVAASAKSLFTDRNDFHHLNKDLERDHSKLEQRALHCLDAIYDIECEIFAYSVSEGVVTIHKPQYWPEGREKGTAQVFIRNIRV
ncbi:hypothetical protein [Ensifer sp. B1-9]|uniref:hypothetical protein n=1 Tax=Ensifer sp. B1-9 TaxID=3141455 RepID=UPI003D1BA87B